MQKKLLPIYYKLSALSRKELRKLDLFVIYGDENCKNRFEVTKYLFEKHPNLMPAQIINLRYFVTANLFLQFSSS